jgi:pilus assembly protein CpaB
VNAVTLEVTPEQAEKLDLARSVGSLSLVLRNQVDTSLVVTNGSTKKNLLNRVEVAVVPTAPVADVKAEFKPIVKKVVRRVSTKNSVEKPVYEQVEVVRGATTTIEEFKPATE